MKKLCLLLMPLVTVSLLTNCGSSPKAKEYVIKFESNGGSPVADRKVQENKRLVKPEDPTKNGYGFENWYTDEALTNEYDFSSLVTSDFTLYAKWSDAITYKINYHMPDGAMQTNPTTYTIETDDITLDNATKNGYEFDGWHVGSAEGKLITTIPKGSYGNLDLYTSETAVAYTIHYENLDGSTTDNPTSYTIESDTITLEDPTDHGYAFTGWHKGSKTGELITEIKKGTTGNLYLYASWDTTPTTYTITYKNVVESEHSTDPESYTVETDTITLSIPVRDANWTFGGWYTDPELKKSTPGIPKGSYGNLTLYAKMVYKETSLDKLSWSDIKMISEKGGARATFGDPGTQTKKVTINDVENKVRIIGYDYDELPTSTKENPKYAGITFEFVNTINDYITFWSNKGSPQYNNYDFINNSNLNECLQSGGDVYKMMPSDLMSVVKTVNKKVEIHPVDKWVVENYNTKLFPLSIDEIDGNDNGTYEYYKIDSEVRRNKTKLYWLRSPNTSNEVFAYYVMSGGFLYYNGITYYMELNVAPAFCI